MYKRAIEWILPISCILLQYQAIVSTYGILILLAMVALYIAKTGYIMLDKQFLLLFLIITIQETICTAIFHIPTETTIKSVVTVFLVVIVTSLSYVDIDKERLIKNFKIIGAVCAIAIFIQSFMYIVLKIPVRSIMILPQDDSVLHYWTTSNVRACGFFTEPQTYCSYMLPLLIICMERKEYKYSAFLTLSFLMTGSSLGILMAGILWGKMLMESDLPIKNKVAFFFSIILGVFAFLTLDVFADAREKISTIYTDYSLYTVGTMTNSHSYTNYLRLIKGWVTFFELPSVAKVVGVGINGLLSFMMSTGTTFSWSGQWGFNSVMVGYFTSAAGVFLECGIVVGSLYYIFVIRKFSVKSQVSRNLIFFLILQSFTTQLFFNGIFTFYFLIYYLFADEKSLIKIIFLRWKNQQSENVQLD